MVCGEGVRGWGGSSFSDPNKAKAAFNARPEVSAAKSIGAHSRGAHAPLWQNTVRAGKGGFFSSAVKLILCIIKFYDKYYGTFWHCVKRTFTQIRTHTLLHTHTQTQAHAHTVIKIAVKAYFLFATYPTHLPTPQTTLTSCLSDCMLVFLWPYLKRVCVRECACVWVWVCML